MAAFTISYRLPSRGLKSEVVDAADRASALAQMKARGITPVSVKEGGKLVAAVSSSAAKPAWLKGAIAGLMVIVIAGITWILLPHGAVPEVKEVEPTRKVTKKNLPGHSGSTEKPNVWTKKALKEVPVESVRQVTNEWDSLQYPGEKLVSSVTNRSTGYIIEVSMTKDGKRTRHVKEPPSIWETSVDGLISSVLQVKEGQELPPMPMMGKEMDSQFLESLKTPIVVRPEDADDVKAIKQIVNSAREEIKARMDAGEHFSDILTDHRNLHNENGRIRSAALKELREIQRTGTQDDVDNFVNAMNQQLERIGISPLPSSKSKNEMDSSRDNNHVNERVEDK